MMPATQVRENISGVIFGVGMPRIFCVPCSKNRTAATIAASRRCSVIRADLRGEGLGQFLGARAGAIDQRDIEPALTQPVNDRARGAAGIGLGFIAYVALKLLSGRLREINAASGTIAGAFLLKLIFA